MDGRAHASRRAGPLRAGLGHDEQGDSARRVHAQGRPGRRRAGPRIGAVPDRPARHAGDQFIAAEGRIFFTSSSPGSTLAPSIYLMSDMVPLPFLRAMLPT
jgi:hypothetical protein